MLKQLVRLNIEADGRYATDQELQFLEDYLQSVDKRISSYKKIRDAEKEIMEQTKAQLDSEHPNLFSRGSQDLSAIWQRDMDIVLRCSAAAMLLNDLDWLRESVLLWQRTIVNANKTRQISQLTYQVLLQIVKQFITEEEAELMMPALQLDQSILS